MSTVEVLIPSLQQRFLARHDDLLDLSKFRTPEPAATMQSYGVQPELGKLVISLDMHVGRLGAIPGEEEESVRAFTGDCRHV
jgi:hypothetical protein